MDNRTKEFQEQTFTKPKVSAVYAIYSLDRRCLYVGESENFYSRLDDHYHSSRGSTIRGCIENDENTNISVDNLWEKTMLRTITGVSNSSKRKQLERELITELEPKYNKQ